MTGIVPVRGYTDSSQVYARSNARTSFCTTDELVMTPIRRTSSKVKEVGEYDTLGLMR